MGRVLPCIYGGVDVADIRVHSDITGLSPSNTYVGGIVGVGIDYMVIQHLAVGFSYSYTWLPKQTYNFGGGLEQYGETASNFLAHIDYRM